MPFSECSVIFHENLLLLLIEYDEVEVVPQRTHITRSLEAGRSALPTGIPRVRNLCLLPSERVVKIHAVSAVTRPVMPSHDDDG